MIDCKRLRVWLEKYKHQRSSITIWYLNKFLKIAQLSTKLFVKEAMWKMKLLQVQRERRYCMHHSLIVPYSNILPGSTLKNPSLPFMTKVLLIGLSLITGCYKRICPSGMLFLAINNTIQIGSTPVLEKCRISWG